MCTLPSELGEERIESSRVVVLRREEWGKTGQERHGGHDGGGGVLVLSTG